MGDEYAENTGRLRINYTREEFLIGVSRSFPEKWRLYAEGGYAYILRNEAFMEPWRVEYGLEYVVENRFWDNRVGWYAAADVSSFEEDDWDQNATIQVGLLLPIKEAERNYRFGIEYYNGRSPIGEFFQNEEKYLAIGFWFDL